MTTTSRRETADDEQGDRQRHGRRDDRARVGRRPPRAQQAAAALVALRRSTPPSCGRSATGSSIRRGRRSTATPRACSATASAARSTKEVADAKAAQAKYFEQIAATPLDDIEKNQELMPFVIAGGAAVFGDNCSPCHGKGAQGAVGYPNLNDDDWLWGGTPGRDRAHDHVRHPLRPPGDARHGDAALRARRHPEAGRDRRRGAARALAVGPGHRCRPRPSAAPRSSPTTAPSATARPARATPSSARRT